ncbi:MAG: carbohydrate-binding domain-containing protein [Ruminococcus sp.]|uniref:carbohydrate-binding domain-containing protein n=1 Tax=Ruminococcus sp. TaxID=41978 RepID=UPI001B0E1421|nr:carbohydrate-binding domain-containing protein [Ruminococcus sp.]MBO7473106.1 carbohydrate-binding domain-containing protein [Ruminococcus sp.]
MKKTYITSAFLMAAMAVYMTGCGNNSSVSENTSVGTNAKTVVSDSAETVEKTAKADKTSSENTDSAEVKQLSNNTQETTFTERDLEQTADTSEAQKITVADNKIIDITDEGVYTINGSAENCTIRVNADDSAKVQLVLDGVDIVNEDFTAIYVLSADKVFITTTDSENTLTVSGQFTADGENNTDAVIYSKDDLVLNGTGTLNVTSYYGNGITCKDDMKITGGTYNVKSALDAFEANDTISVYDGNFNITTNKDGFHCENDEAEGSITISDGTFTINGGSDGIQACAVLQIDGGDFNITAAEGLEATYIVINDGNITIDASDDGINAVTNTNAYETAIVFNGGNVNVSMGQGDTDAIDSNGSIYVNGGTINITAQMSSFDYDRTAEFNGGTIIVNGQEVSEIPQSMMGGGMRGGMNSGFGGGRGGRF